VRYGLPDHIRLLWTSRYDTGYSAANTTYFRADGIDPDNRTFYNGPASLPPAAGKVAGPRGDGRHGGQEFRKRGGFIPLTSPWNRVWIQNAPGLPGVFFLFAEPAVHEL
jgi:hypothetical protein